VQIGRSNGIEIGKPDTPLNAFRARPPCQVSPAFQSKSACFLAVQSGLWIKDAKRQPDGFFRAKHKALHGRVSASSFNERLNCHDRRCDTFSGSPTTPIAASALRLDVFGPRSTLITAPKKPGNVACAWVVIIAEIIGLFVDLVTGKIADHPVDCFISARPLIFQVACSGHSDIGTAPVELRTQRKAFFSGVSDFLRWFDAQPSSPFQAAAPRLNASEISRAD
jgi:hypothetical protein